MARRSAAAESRARLVDALLSASRVMVALAARSLADLDADVTLPQFRTFTQSVCPELIEYGERSSPRTKIDDGVYTSTDHPADQPIVLHNEQSYTLNWPLKIWRDPPSGRFASHPGAREFTSVRMAYRVAG